MTNLKLPHPQKCKLYHDLWTDRGWIHRRIDEISFTERGMMQVKSTFDLDIAYLKKKISKLPKRLRKGDQIALPLMVLPRTLLLDIDVTLDGKAQSFASTETSTDITRYIYLQEYLNNYIFNNSECNKLSSFKKLPPEALEEINYISNLTNHVFRQGGRDYIAKRRKHIVEEFERYDDQLSSFKKDPTSNQIAGQSIIKDLSDKITKCDKELSILDQVALPCNDKNSSLEPYRWEKWSRFSEDYIAVVLVDLPKDRRRAKLTYITRTSPDYSKASNIFPIRTSSPTVACASLLGSGVERRYHFRVNAPDGHYISSLSLADTRNDNNEVAFHQPTASSEKDSCVNKNNAEPVACVTADGADLTFLEIKDKTPEEKGNIFGYTLNIGVEPFPQTFMSRAQVAIFF